MNIQGDPVSKIIRQARHGGTLSLIPPLGRQAALCEVKAILVYKGSPRTARDTQ